MQYIHTTCAHKNLYFIHKIQTLCEAQSHVNVATAWPQRESVKSPRTEQSTKKSFHHLPGRSSPHPTSVTLPSLLHFEFLHLFLAFFRSLYLSFSSRSQPLWLPFTKFSTGRLILKYSSCPVRLFLSASPLWYLIIHRTHTCTHFIALNINFRRVCDVFWGDVSCSQPCCFPENRHVGSGTPFTPHQPWTSHLCRLPTSHQH